MNILCYIIGIEIAILLGIKILSIILVIVNAIVNKE